MINKLRFKCYMNRMNSFQHILLVEIESNFFLNLLQFESSFESLKEVVLIALLEILSW